MLGPAWLDELRQNWLERLQDIMATISNDLDAWIAGQVASPPTIHDHHQSLFLGPAVPELRDAWRALTSRVVRALLDRMSRDGEPLRELAEESDEDLPDTAFIVDAGESGHSEDDPPEGAFNVT